MTDVKEKESKTALQPNIDELTFVKLKCPRCIPLELIEHVKGRTFSPEQFYKYQESQVDNPFNHLYVLIDNLKIIQGYLWAEMNSLDASLFVNTFSITKGYWGKGSAIANVSKFLDALRKKLKAERVYWITINDKFFAKHGFKRSKNVLMEYQSPKN